jgi:hypothetical protein
MVLFICFCLMYSSSFGQIQLPISGTYKVESPTYFDKVEVKNQIINTYNNGKIVGTFFALEKVSDFYVFEVTKPGSLTLDTNPKRDRRLLKIKVVKIDEAEYSFTITNPNGTQENVTLIK